MGVPREKPLRVEKRTNHKLIMNFFGTKVFLDLFFPDLELVFLLTLSDINYTSSLQNNYP